MVARISKRVVIVVLALAAFVAFGIVVPRPLWHDEPAARSQRILVLSNPIHTDIAIPVDDDLLARFGFLRASGLDLDNPNLRYIVFGWGGRSFYTETRSWADLKAAPVLKSFLLDRSVIHVELAGTISTDVPGVTALRIDSDGLQRLKQFILDNLVEAGGEPMPLLGSNYGANDASFQAKGYFNALMGCNTWTAAGLRQAGVTSGLWTALPWMLRLSLRLHNGDAVFGSGGD